MSSALAYVESGDSSATNLIIVFGGVFTVAAVAATVFATRDKLRADPFFGAFCHYFYDN
jgi:hypothetical protein